MHAGRELRLRSEALEWREVEGQIVALDLPASRYFSVNRTGAALWPSLLAGTSREALGQELVDVFGVDRATAEHDLDAFLASLRERKLLEP